MLRAFPHVIIMYCTYKTNKYKLSLLKIVVVTSTNMTISITCAYLEFENEDNYPWVLERLKYLMDEDFIPSIIIIDRDKALMNAIRKVFSIFAR